MSKRALIVSMSLGGGHRRAGESVAAALEELGGGWEARCIDLSDYVARWFRAGYVAAYLFVIRHAPWVWGWLYRRPPRPQGGTLPPWLLRRALTPYARLLEQTQPHAVLATQITGSEATSLLRARGLYRGPAATVVTDFDSHPAWRASEIDRFFVPDETIRQEFIEAGIPAERLEATGVPVAPAFAGPFDVPALKAKHGIRPRVPVGLLMGGSLGLGPLAEAVEKLLAIAPACELLVVAGHNRRLRRRLERIAAPEHSRLRVFGFVDYVAELMAVADLFVSKPGGLSMTEALALGLPTLTFAPLPGQEVANARHLAAKGLVKAVPEGESLAQAAVALLEDEAERRRLAEAARAYARPHAARHIAGRLVELADR
ncbi:MAG: MGDG synthase family glycosyltransferase [Candidatus Brocadiia bacterium]